VRAAVVAVSKKLMSTHIMHVVGARPNFMKAASTLQALARRNNIRQSLVHTGQHYDANMSDVFFQQLGLPEPDVNLAVGSGSHAQQTAEIMARFEPHVLNEKPDLVLVYGDVNSTVAAALVCAKLRVPVGHVEAGLRSFDRMMPEEINRVLTDQLADLLFTPSSDANENLAREGIPAEKIHFVGNVMIDTLVRLLPRCEEHLPSGLPQLYALVTLHRPSNVDDPEWLEQLLQTLSELSCHLSVMFSIHPRTRERLRECKSRVGADGKLRLHDPFPYLQFLALQRRAAVVSTDSGGIQEETTWLGVPCLTVRENTERPVTVSCGTNLLIGRETDRLREEVDRILSGSKKTGQVPPLWDGCAAERIADIIVQAF